MRLKLVSNNTSINFLKFHRLAVVISSVLVLLSIGLFAVVGLNLGIDFRGGILVEARHNSGPADIAGLRGKLKSLGLGDISLQGFGTDTDILVRIQRQEGDEKAQIAAIQLVSKTLGNNFDIRRTEFVGPTVGAELAEKGIMAVICLSLIHI